MTKQGQARIGLAHGITVGAIIESSAIESSAIELSAIELSAIEAAARSRDGDLPVWVPEAARDYLAHIEGGRTIRSIAREAQVHPSTILRRVRRVEASRDDPLVDAALRHLSAAEADPVAVQAQCSEPPIPRLPIASIEARALPFLRRLAEPGTLLAVARDMDNGVILREGQAGEPHRLAVVTRDLAEAMALQDWIACADHEARIRRYGIAPAGRSVLRRAVQQAAQGMAEAQAGFHGAEEGTDQRLRHMRSLMAESPLAALARRRDGEGKAFLDRDQVVAGERLREDYEAALQGGVVVSWDEVMARPRDFTEAPQGAQHRPAAALARVARALVVLGPGLADVALGCCGLLEGLEALEKRLGWSARSGKVVLRIALDRLRRHYLIEEATGGSLIG